MAQIYLRSGQLEAVSVGCSAGHSAGSPAAAHFCWLVGQLAEGLSSGCDSRAVVAGRPAAAPGLFCSAAVVTGVGPGLHAW